MNTETVGNLVLALPPIAEQTRILGNLDDFGRQHDKMAGHLERQIRAFLEYRQALITAAVTGQLAVTKDSA
jgi:type I restriction enzyme S subunit